MADEARFPAITAVAAIAGWLVVCELTTELWYRAHERPTHGRLAWNVAWPRSDPGFRAAPLPESARTILRCDEGQSGVWKRPDGSEWTLFFLKWHPGRMAAQLATGHTPDVCLPSRGFKRLAGPGFICVQAHRLEFPFNTYVFESAGRLYYVFFCLMDERGALVSPQAATAAENYLEALRRPQRLRAVLDGNRHRGQQVLEIAITGHASEASAQRALQEALSGLIHITHRHS